MFNLGLLDCVLQDAPASEDSWTVIIVVVCAGALFVAASATAVWWFGCKDGGGDVDVDGDGGGKHKGNAQVKGFSMSFANPTFGEDGDL